MDNFYGIALSLLFLFAIFDLIIGVGNDAVNFLNSAIGSKVASRTTIMTFSSLGIFLGALFSNGMMEIARKGIFNPYYFHFSDIFFIFLAVMITDIILLDIFNTFGLPTSTTVSIVFSLLGASFIIALNKFISPNSKEALYFLSNYINIGRTLSMILGIFLSIIISFFFGAIIHYFIRYIFSFNYENKIKNIGIIWSSISLTSMTYFLIIEGLHGSIKNILIAKENKNYINILFLFFDFINHNLLISIIILFIIWVIISKLMLKLKINIFKFTVLYGTFALAMAFSGNDLVNFIGVPVAGFQSYLIWTDANNPNPNSLYMGRLLHNVQISPLVLFIAGLIMILTIWFSRKIRNVSDTEINLGAHQDEINENLSSNFLSRIIVKFSLFFGKHFFNIFSKRFLVKIEQKFKNKKINHASFDLIRASANLTISSIIISIATAKKLPLSTTFVTFMVSMGTSFSDRAWDRESAVYKVFGVLRVITGWFLTGILAFIMSAIFAIFIYLLRYTAIIILIFIIGFIIYKNYKKNKKLEKIKYNKKNYIKNINNLNEEFIINNINNLLILILDSMNNIYHSYLESICKENETLAKNNRKYFLELKEKILSYKESIIIIIRNIQTNDSNSNITLFYIKMYNEFNNIIKSLDLITNYAIIHIINSHRPLTIKQLKKLNILINIIIKYLYFSKNILIKNKKLLFLSQKKYLKNIFNEIDNQIKYQIKGIIQNKYGAINTKLVFNILLNTQSIIKNIENIIYIYFNI